MAGGQNKLTVSYGTFSCTLEGFDDAFTTMKAVAEYFRELSAQDRYFGAIPPVPDAAMLERLAEAEVRRRVEMRIAESGVALKAKSEAPLRTRAFEMPPEAVATAQPLTPAAPPPGESVAARLARLRAVAARARAAEPARAPSIFAEDEDAEAAAPVAPAGAPAAPHLAAPVAAAVPEPVAPAAPAQPLPMPPAAEAPAPVVAPQPVPELAPEPEVVQPDAPAAVEQPESAPESIVAPPAPLAPRAPVETTASPDVADAAPAEAPPAPAPMLLTTPVATPMPKAEVAAQLRDFMTRLHASEQAATGTPAPAAPRPAPVETAAPRPTPPKALFPQSAAPTPAPAPDPRERRKAEPADAPAREFDRLMETAKSQLEVADNRRRIDAMSHMKAAVAATEADRELFSDEEAERGAAEQLGRFRDDLSRLVQAQPAPEAPRRREEPAAPRPAPLVLASEQRIDQALDRGISALAAPTGAGRGAGATSVYLAGPRAGDADAALGAAARRTPSMPFAEFAASLGAQGLEGMMEAAAAYLSVQEGREFFSRPLIMRRVALVVAEDAYSREDGLRAFGALLRQGRIAKLRRGQFTISQGSRFIDRARGLTH